MKIIEPSVELWSEENVTPEEHIARCAAVCYDSRPKDPKKLCEGLVKNGHLSMLRHATHYYSTMGNDRGKLAPSYTSYVFTSGQKDTFDDKPLVVSANGQADLEYKDRFDFGTPVSLEEVLDKAKSIPQIFSIVRLTFCITTQISTSRELNRVSPNNIAERSTRYCSSKDGLEICRPYWFFDDETEENVIAAKRAAIHCWETAEAQYKYVMDMGMKPQAARELLPLATATKVVYTYTVKEWQHILDLRLYGKTGKPHPNATWVMRMVRDQINKFAREHGIDYDV